MPANTASLPKELNLRQTIEGMPLIFNPAAAEGLQAVIQFNVSGKEPGRYYLKIDGGNCTFHTGVAPAATLTIDTPSEVWLQVSNGQLSGQDALFKGLYKANGDIGTLIKMGEIFKSPEDFTIYDNSAPLQGQLFPLFQHKSHAEISNSPAGVRPAGPIPLSGMGWMTVFFAIWTFYWICFDISSLNPWIGSAIPLALMTAVIIYRVIYNSPVWIEVASWCFFLLALALAPVMRLPVFLAWGSITGSLFMAILWLVSLAPLIKLPFCAEYSKWGYVRKLWSNSMFIHPNLAISLVWGWQFIIASSFGIAARLYPDLFIPFTAVRYLLIIPAAIFTARYQKGALDRKFPDIDKTMAALRSWGYAGLAVAAAILLLVWLVLPLPQ